ncbi:hypothetical protein O99_00626 [Bartonella rochalimae ATCC BAA-1498]|uniref:Uncharacterized protein n=1 Tax=Bartonella rochalimae ATCC BAA-1498 TaxID=685782 RepID=E6YN02_9HYPH|nr:hypothetical protein O99_00626 [Bartonella rochalimae ATCC BAA-1498]CBI78240.1 hypothetical protein BARRO_90003 [Bartonella rochalimae ATCC BAA-1498]
MSIVVTISDLIEHKWLGIKYFFGFYVFFKYLDIFLPKKTSAFDSKAKVLCLKLAVI